jgi:hypothetical protein
MIFRNPPAFTVTDAYDGAAIPDVQATLTDADGHVWILDCIFAPFPGTTDCSWPESPPIVAGTYSLHITALHFESATVEEKVISPSYCGERISRFEPETVSLQRL